ncbi:MAG: molecular chaperone HtpG [Candidatus Scalindua sp. AMX11]|nr:MAG: molecular chaperone HtpG [Candidatus Scalindua sp.]NOG85461.1 molecular chaperone HtpG [Planctomycetota bacterium]RZV90287.1 MAG: molecular chaperone HtpG [Candidatus Scalindua sp. SCAELEC01]TDE64698.1 MAG: molecular chaperone HtpG [Candidatus Scalindua sp. AMX11]GJQ60806.1 MAG: chaperone protein HtpG [Candidatus Scalindua sp.]
MTVKKMDFKTETKQILDLVVHSLYSHKEIFLRELISNASDAIDKAHFQSLTDKEILDDKNPWKIKIEVDKDAGTLTIRDNGIGMTKEDAIRELGTIAHSGTKEFLAAMQSKEVKENPELIGQFGVGFYSSFMVADKVTVISRKAGTKDKKGIKWESTADGSFTIEDVDKEEKGTEITLHLKDEEKKYLEEWEIRSVVKKYSDFIEHPIVMDIEREEEGKIDKSQKVKVKEEETLNARKAIWLKNKSDITEAEYNEFYKHLSHDYTDPAKVVHYKAEGASEFTALFYIPAIRPMDILYKEYKMGLTLYAKRVKIIEHCEALIQPYLRFVKGVVDSSDLPLNVSREMLQNNRQVETMKNSITTKVLGTLNDMKKNDYDKYLKFYHEFGRILKEGIHFDFSKREQIGELLLFPSTKTDKESFRTIEDYVGDMKEGQEDIYYITGTSRDEVLKSPYLEAFNEKGYEVLILLDDIDDIVMGQFEYKGKKFKSVIKGDITLDETKKDEKEKAQKKYGKILKLIQDHLEEDLKEVRLSGRLKDSACCLVADEGEMDPQMEKLLKSMGQDVPTRKRILEINPAHPLFEAMSGIFEKDKKSEVLKEYATLLYDQALLLEGSKPKDTVSFAKAIAKLMVDNAGQNS